MKLWRRVATQALCAFAEEVAATHHRPVKASVKEATKANLLYWERHVPNLLSLLAAGIKVGDVGVSRLVDTLERILRSLH